MENLVSASLFNGTYQGRKVLVTGHTGFKGSWLVEWLQQMGAQVCGVALAPATQPSHIEVLKPELSSDCELNILNLEQLRECFERFKPDMVFHLAAQALVRESYRAPVETIATNVLGTAHVLECAKAQSETKVLVNITTDKCYENPETGKPFKESDPMGGYDPYSASKACAEIVSSSYRSSFGDDLLIATARAGNVIGGGDWANDRLIPDIVLATRNNESVELRSPKAIRPWQHVLEPLSAYLLLGQQLWNETPDMASAWNFGPEPEMDLTVEELLKAFDRYYPLSYVLTNPEASMHEAQYLRLDCSKASKALGWQPVLGKESTLEMTAQWYRAFYDDGQCITRQQIREYVNLAKAKGAIWA